MQPDISEFSYGYCLTEELANHSGLKFQAAPVFPSLIAEGKLGYDVALLISGRPLFVQFKLSHCMVRGTANEVKRKKLETPFYRFHLRPKRHSKQHQLLVDLEARGHLVLYAAPSFHQRDELNDAYIARKVVARSFFCRPSAIGSLPDGKDHHVAFAPGQSAYFCSRRPTLLRPVRDEQRELEDYVLTWAADAPPMEQSREAWRALADELVSVTRHRISAREFMSDAKLTALNLREPEAQAAYLARAFFGCELLVVRKRAAAQ